MGEVGIALQIDLVTLASNSGASGPHEINDRKVRRYVAALRAGDIFPPVRLVDYDGDLHIIDGRHRVAASDATGIPIPALIAVGESFEDLDCELRGSDAGRADDEQHWRMIARLTTPHKEPTQ